MQCERRAAGEKRAHVNPWLSGDTSGPGSPLPLPPAPPNPGRYEPGGAPGAAAAATAPTCGSGSGVCFAW